MQRIDRASPDHVDALAGGAAIGGSGAAIGGSSGVRAPEGCVDALITDAMQRQALVAIRELGRTGVSCGAIDSDPTTPAFASRWCALSAVVPDFVDDQDAFVDGVIAFCTEHSPRALIPMHDGSIEALRRRREELERVVGLAMAPEQALAVAVDKARTLEHGQAVGLSGPRGVLVRDLAEMEAALGDLGVPLVIKPTHTWVQGDEVGRRLRATVATTHAQASTIAAEMLEYETHLMLQEWLSGAREAISLMCAQGRIWARFAQRADRMLPPLGGNSILRESIPLPPDITPAAERLVLEMGLDGYSEVEFRRGADGRPALMEINPRLSASVEIAVRAGVPFPGLLYTWASGGALQEVDGYRVGKRMRWLGGDLQWLEEALRRPGQPDVPSRAEAIRMFMTACMRPMSYDYLDRHDPRPAWVATSGAMRQLRWRANRFRRKAVFGKGMTSRDQR